MGVGVGMGALGCKGEGEVVIVWSVGFAALGGLVSGVGFGDSHGCGEGELGPLSGLWMCSIAGPLRRSVSLSYLWSRAPSTLMPAPQEQEHHDLCRP